MPTFTHAITRLPGENCAQGLTTADLGAPNYNLLCAQHEAYVAALVAPGLEVTILNAEPDYPDAYFIEDAAIVTPTVAVITRPGAETRRGEEQSVAPVLAQYRELAHIEAPGTLEGGDVLVVGNTVFVGISERTNPEGASQLGGILAAHGMACCPIRVAAGLHLKSSLNHVGGDVLLVTPDFADRPELDGYRRIVIDAGEEYAANTLLVNDTLIVPAGFPSTRRKLATLGMPILELDMSEAQKMDGGLTCFSLRF
jgi:dimethylargininase